MLVWPFWRWTPTARFRREAIVRGGWPVLVEGPVDEAIARRRSMRVRTCRGHIAKLSAALGSGSRAQLGYLIARPGILDDRTADPAD